jgi:hypothetical protein
MVIKIIFLLSFFISFIQTAEVKFPSLAELAQKATEIPVKSLEYEKLSLEAKQQILDRKGTLQQVLNFVKNSHDSVTQDLNASVPTKLWEALLNESITIQSFIDQIKDFSRAEQRWLTGALTETVLNLLNPDEITVFALRKFLDVITHKLPIDFEIKQDANQNSRNHPA